MRDSCAPASQPYRWALVRNHAVASVRCRRSRHTIRMLIERGLRALESSRVVRSLRETDLRGWRCLRGRQQQGRFHLRGNAFQSGDLLVWREAQNRITGRANDQNRHHKQPKHRPHPRKMDPGLLFGKLAPRQTRGIAPVPTQSWSGTESRSSECPRSSSGCTVRSTSASGSSSSNA